MHDVARRAGVSQTTVSLVLNDPENSGIPPATQERVHAAVQEVGYRPNRLARAMSEGRSYIIGLVVSHLENPFYAEAIKRFHKALQARGYHIVIVTAPNDGEHVDRLVRDTFEPKA